MNRQVTNVLLAILIITSIGIVSCNKDNPILSALIGSGPGEPIPSGAITGMVTESTGGTPIAGVTVSTTPATRADTTDLDGRYLLIGVPIDTYAVTAVKSGYNSNTVFAEVIEDDTVTADIEMDPFDGSIEIEWITVPAGTFTMGSLPIDPHAQVDEQPQHVVYLDEYQISRYEITNAQYLVFMDDGGYFDSTYWTPTGWEWRSTYNVIEPYWWTEGDFSNFATKLVFDFYEFISHINLLRFLFRWRHDFFHILI